jgi:hypothetical protein
MVLTASGHCIGFREPLGHFVGTRTVELDVHKEGTKRLLLKSLPRMTPLEVVAQNQVTPLKCEPTHM